MSFVEIVYCYDTSVLSCVPSEGGRLAVNLALLMSLAGRVLILFRTNH